MKISNKQKTSIMFAVLVTALFILLPVCDAYSRADAVSDMTFVETYVDPNTEAKADRYIGDMDLSEFEEPADLSLLPPLLEPMTSEEVDAFVDDAMSKLPPIDASMDDLTDPPGIIQEITQEQEVFTTPSQMSNVDEEMECIMPGTPGAEISGAGFDIMGMGPGAVGEMSLEEFQSIMRQAGFENLGAARGGTQQGGMGGFGEHADPRDYRNQFYGTKEAARQAAGGKTGGGGEDTSYGGEYYSAKARLDYLQTIMDWANSVGEEGYGVAKMLEELVQNPEARDEFGDGINQLGPPEKWGAVAQGIMDAYNGMAETFKDYANNLGTFKKITNALQDKSGKGAGTHIYNYEGLKHDIIGGKKYDPENFKKLNKQKDALEKQIGELRAVEKRTPAQDKLLNELIEKLDGKPKRDAEGNIMKDPKTGKTMWETEGIRTKFGEAKNEDLQSALDYYGTLTSASTDIKNFEAELEQFSSMPVGQLADAMLADAKGKYDAAKSDYDSGLISKEEFDAAKNDYNDLQGKKSDGTLKDYVRGQQQKKEQEIKAKIAQAKRDYEAAKQGKDLKSERELAALEEQLTSTGQEITDIDKKIADLKEEIAGPQFSEEKLIELQEELDKLEQKKKDLEKQNQDLKDKKGKIEQQTKVTEKAKRDAFNKYLKGIAKDEGLNTGADALKWIGWQAFDAKLESAIGKPSSIDPKTGNVIEGTGLHASLETLGGLIESTGAFLDPDFMKDMKEDFGDYSERLDDLHDSFDALKAAENAAKADGHISDEEDEDIKDKQQDINKEILDLGADIMKSLKEFLKELSEMTADELEDWWDNRNKSPAEGGIGETPKSPCCKDAKCKPPKCPPNCGPGIYATEEGKDGAPSAEPSETPPPPEGSPPEGETPAPQTPTFGVVAITGSAVAGAQEGGMEPATGPSWPGGMEPVGPDGLPLPPPEEGEEEGECGIKRKKCYAFPPIPEAPMDAPPDGKKIFQGSSKIGISNHDRSAVVKSGDLDITIRQVDEEDEETEIKIGLNDVLNKNAAAVDLQPVVRKRNIGFMGFAGEYKETKDNRFTVKLKMPCDNAPKSTSGSIGPAAISSEAVLDITGAIPRTPGQTGPASQLPVTVGVTELGEEFGKGMCEVTLTFDKSSFKGAFEKISDPDKASDALVEAVLTKLINDYGGKAGPRDVYAKSDRRTWKDKMDKKYVVGPHGKGFIPKGTSGDAKKRHSQTVGKAQTGYDDAYKAHTAARKALQVILDDPKLKDDPNAVNNAKTNLKKAKDNLDKAKKNLDAAKKKYSQTLYKGGFTDEQQRKFDIAVGNANAAKLASLSNHIDRTLHPDPNQRDDEKRHMQLKTENEELIEDVKAMAATWKGMASPAVIRQKQQALFEDLIWNGKFKGPDADKIWKDIQDQEKARDQKIKELSSALDYNNPKGYARTVNNLVKQASAFAKAQNAPSWNEDGAPENVAAAKQEVDKLTKEIKDLQAQRDVLFAATAKSIGVEAASALFLEKQKGAYEEISSTIARLRNKQVHAETDLKHAKTALENMVAKANKELAKIKKELDENREKIEKQKKEIEDRFDSLKHKKMMAPGLAAHMTDLKKKAFFEHLKDSEKKDFQNNFDKEIDAIMKGLVADTPSNSAHTAAADGKPPKFASVVDFPVAFDAGGNIINGALGDLLPGKKGSHTQAAAKEAAASFNFNLFVDENPPPFDLWMEIMQKKGHLFQRATENLNRLRGLFRKVRLGEVDSEGLKKIEKAAVELEKLSGAYEGPKIEKVVPPFPTGPPEQAPAMPTPPGVPSTAPSGAPPAAIYPGMTPTPTPPPTLPPQTPLPTPAAIADITGEVSMETRMKVSKAWEDIKSGIGYVLSGGETPTKGLTARQRIQLQQKRDKAVADRLAYLETPLTEEQKKIKKQAGTEVGNTLLEKSIHKVSNNVAQLHSDVMQEAKNSGTKGHQLDALLWAGRHFSNVDMFKSLNKAEADLKNKKTGMQKKIAKIKERLGEIEKERKKNQKFLAETTRLQNEGKLSREEFKRRSDEYYKKKEELNAEEESLKRDLKFYENSVKEVEKEIKELRKQVEVRMLWDERMRMAMSEIDTFNDLITFLVKDQEFDFKSISAWETWIFESSDRESKTKSEQLGKSLLNGLDKFFAVQEALAAQGKNLAEIFKKGTEGYEDLLDELDTQNENPSAHTVKRLLERLGVDTSKFSNKDLKDFGLYLDTFGKSLIKQVEGTFSQDEFSLGFYKTGLLKENWGDFEGAQKDYNTWEGMAEGVFIKELARTNADRIKLKTNVREINRAVLDIVLDPLNLLTLGTYALAKSGLTAGKAIKAANNLRKAVADGARAGKIVGAASKVTQFGKTVNKGLQIGAKGLELGIRTADGAIDIVEGVGKGLKFVGGEMVKPVTKTARKAADKITDLLYGGTKYGDDIAERTSNINKIRSELETAKLLGNQNDVARLTGKLDDAMKELNDLKNAASQETKLGRFGNGVKKAFSNKGNRAVWDDAADLRKKVGSNLDDLKKAEDKLAKLGSKGRATPTGRELIKEIDDLKNGIKKGREQIKALDDGAKIINREQGIFTKHRHLDKAGRAGQKSVDNAFDAYKAALNRVKNARKAEKGIDEAFDALKAAQNQLENAENALKGIEYSSLAGQLEDVWNLNFERWGQRFQKFRYDKGLGLKGYKSWYETTDAQRKAFFEAEKNLNRIRRAEDIAGARNTVDRLNNVLETARRNLNQARKTGIEMEKAESAFNRAQKAANAARDVFNKKIETIGTAFEELENARGSFKQAARTGTALDQASKIARKPSKADQATPGFLAGKADDVGRDVERIEDHLAEMRKNFEASPTVENARELQQADDALKNAARKEAQVQEQLSEASRRVALEQPAPVVEATPENLANLRSQEKVIENELDAITTKYFEKYGDEAFSPKFREENLQFAEEFGEKYLRLSEARAQINKVDAELRLKAAQPPKAMPPKTAKAAILDDVGIKSDEMFRIGTPDGRFKPATYDDVDDVLRAKGKVGPDVEITKDMRGAMVAEYGDELGIKSYDVFRDASGRMVSKADAQAALSAHAEKYVDDAVRRGSIDSDKLKQFAKDNDLKLKVDAENKLVFEDAFGVEKKFDDMYNDYTDDIYAQSTKRKAAEREARKAMKRGQPAEANEWKKIANEHRREEISLRKNKKALQEAHDEAFKEGLDFNARKTAAEKDIPFEQAKYEETAKLYEGQQARMDDIKQRSAKTREEAGKARAEGDVKLAEAKEAEVERLNGEYRTISREEDILYAERNAAYAEVQPKIEVDTSVSLPDADARLAKEAAEESKAAADAAELKAIDDASEINEFASNPKVKDDLDDALPPKTASCGSPCEFGAVMKNKIQKQAEPALKDPELRARIDENLGRTVDDAELDQFAEDFASELFKNPDWEYDAVAKWFESKGVELAPEDIQKIYEAEAILEHSGLPADRVAKIEKVIDDAKDAAKRVAAEAPPAEVPKFPEVAPPKELPPIEVRRAAYTKGFEEDLGKVLADWKNNEQVKDALKQTGITLDGDVSVNLVPPTAPHDTTYRAVFKVGDTEIGRYQISFMHGEDALRGTDAFFKEGDTIKLGLIELEVPFRGKGLGKPVTDTTRKLMEMNFPDNMIITRPVHPATLKGAKVKYGGVLKTANTEPLGKLPAKMRDEYIHYAVMDLYQGEKGEKTLKTMRGYDVEGWVSPRMHGDDMVDSMVHSGYSRDAAVIHLESIQYADGTPVFTPAEIDDMLKGREFPGQVPDYLKLDLDNYKAKSSYYEWKAKQPELPVEKPAVPEVAPPIPEAPKVPEAVPKAPEVAPPVPKISPRIKVGQDIKSGFKKVESQLDDAVVSIDEYLEYDQFKWMYGEPVQKGDLWGVKSHPILDKYPESYFRGMRIDKNEVENVLNTIAEEGHLTKYTHEGVINVNSAWSKPEHGYEGIKGRLGGINNALDYGNPVYKNNRVGVIMVIDPDEVKYGWKAAGDGTFITPKDLPPEATQAIYLVDYKNQKFVPVYEAKKVPVPEAPKVPEVELPKRAVAEVGAPPKVETPVEVRNALDSDIGWKIDPEDPDVLVNLETGDQLRLGASDAKSSLQTRRNAYLEDFRKKGLDGFGEENVKKTGRSLPEAKYEESQKIAQAYDDEITYWKERKAYALEHKDELGWQAESRIETADEKLKQLVPEKSKVMEEQTELYTSIRGDLEIPEEVVVRVADEDALKVVEKADEFSAEEYIGKVVDEQIERNFPALSPETKEELAKRMRKASEACTCDIPGPGQTPEDAASKKIFRQYDELYDSLDQPTKDALKDAVARERGVPITEVADDDIKAMFKETGENVGTEVVTNKFTRKDTGMEMVKEAVEDGVVTRKESPLVKYGEAWAADDPDVVKVATDVRDEAARRIAAAEAPTTRPGSFEDLNMQYSAAETRMKTLQSELEDTIKQYDDLYNKPPEEISDFNKWREDLAEINVERAKVEGQIKEVAAEGAMLRMKLLNNKMPQPLGTHQKIGSPFVVDDYEKAMDTYGLAMKHYLGDSADVLFDNPDFMRGLLRGDDPNELMRIASESKVPLSADEIAGFKLLDKSNMNQGFMYQLTGKDAREFGRGITKGDIGGPLLDEEKDFLFWFTGNSGEIGSAKLYELYSGPQASARWNVVKDDFLNHVKNMDWSESYVAKKGLPKDPEAVLKRYENAMDYLEGRINSHYTKKPVAEVPGVPVTPKAPPEEVTKLYVPKEKLPEPKDVMIKRDVGGDFVLDMSGRGASNAEIRDVLRAHLKERGVSPDLAEDLTWRSMEDAAERLAAEGRHEEALNMIKPHFDTYFKDEFIDYSIPYSQGEKITLKRIVSLEDETAGTFIGAKETGEEVIVKVYRQWPTGAADEKTIWREFTKQFDNEIESLNKLDEMGVPVNKVASKADIGGNPAYIIEDFKGKTLDELTDAEKSLISQKTIDQLGEARDAILDAGYVPDELKFVIATEDVGRFKKGDIIITNTEGFKPMPKTTAAAEYFMRDFRTGIKRQMMNIKDAGADAGRRVSLATPEAKGRLVSKAEVPTAKKVPSIVPEEISGKVNSLDEIVAEFGEDISKIEGTALSKGVNKAEVIELNGKPFVRKEFKQAEVWGLSHPERMQNEIAGKRIVSSYFADVGVPEAFAYVGKDGKHYAVSEFLTNAKEDALKIRHLTPEQRSDIAVLDLVFGFQDIKVDNILFDEAGKMFLIDTEFFFMSRKNYEDILYELRFWTGARGREMALHKYPHLRKTVMKAGKETEALLTAEDFKTAFARVDQIKNDPNLKQNLESILRKAGKPEDKIPSIISDIEHNIDNFDKNLEKLISFSNELRNPPKSIPEALSGKISSLDNIVAQYDADPSKVVGESLGETLHKPRKINLKGDDFAIKEFKDMPVDVYRLKSELAGRDIVKKYFPDISAPEATAFLGEDNKYYLLSDWKEGITPDIGKFNNLPPAQRSDLTVLEYVFGLSDLHADNIAFGAKGELSLVDMEQLFAKRVQDFAKGTGREEFLDDLMRGFKPTMEKRVIVEDKVVEMPLKLEDFQAAIDKVNTLENNPEFLLDVRVILGNSGLKGEELHAAIATVRYNLHNFERNLMTSIEWSNEIRGVPSAGLADRIPAEIGGAVPATESAEPSFLSQLINWALGKEKAGV